VRVCLFGGAPGADWQTAIAHGLPDGARVEVLPNASSAAAALRAAASAFRGEDLILLRAGTVLPTFWYERLIGALNLPDVLVASPLDNVDPARAALPAGAHSAAHARVIDALCFRFGRRTALDWSSFSPLLSVWRGAALRDLDLDKIEDCALPALYAPLRALLLDHLYAADPARPLRGPALQAPGQSAPPPSALGDLRERVHAVLSNPHDLAESYPGLDAKPVVLHVLHGWGGGAERFVRDLAKTDTERHHLVLTARGDFERRRYGEILELRDSSLALPALRELPLSDPIASTRFGDRSYRAFLDTIIRDFNVEAIIVSSLIGHSLDALRTGLPTRYVVHDAYPLWPLLHRNLDDGKAPFDAQHLATDLARSGEGFEFAERDPDYWLTLREALADALLKAQAHLIAPTRSALAILLRLQPRLSTLPQSIIPHGIAPWPAGPVSVPLSSPPPRQRLRLLVLGRVRGGKAAHLLRSVVPELSDDVELFLLGAGAEGREFFGCRNVHVLLNYLSADLPALLGRIAPDAALMAPNLAETFSYTLSELRSFGIPVIATLLGALAERIRDGIDGFLVTPDAKSIVELIARVQADRTVLARMRAELARQPLRTLDDMVADYRDLLPRGGRAGARYALADADPDRLVAQTRAALLGTAARETVSLKSDIAYRQRELEKRTEWAFDLDKQLKHAGSEIERLHEETLQLKQTVDDRTAWARAAVDAEQHTRAALMRLHGEFAERTEWAKALDAELESMRASTSWRITKPLRFIKRKTHALITRLRYAFGRLRAIRHRTRGSLASRGFIGTLKRAASEFRAVPPLTEPLTIETPGDEFTPFAVPTSAQPRVSIVIPVHNKIAYTAACLHSLAEHAGTTPFEVIVVDDASSDATAERLAQIGGVQAVPNAQNLGFVGSCNAGAQNAKGEFVLFLNNDTVVTPGWLEALLRCADEEPDAGLVGAKLVYPDGRLQEAGGIVFADGSGWNYGRFDDPNDPRYNFRREADYCSGAAVLLRRELFHALGGFDARYAPAYYEDTDLAFAVRAAGKKILFEPRSTVIHFEGVTAGTDTGSGIKRHQVINREKFVEKWKTALAEQPAPIDDATRADTAANWRARGHVLIVDAYTPTPDQDSGSLRMLNLMCLLRESGYAVHFLPDNRAHAGRYTEALQALGIEALYHPFVADPIAWLRTHGRTLNAIVLSRHYVAANYIGLARLYAPQARLIFDTVDLHYLREQRAAELERSADLAAQAARTRAQEWKLMRECDVSLVVSATEKELLARELPQARIEVLSNVHAVYGRRREFAERRDLVFVGGFQHPPNIDAVLWFVHEVFPHVRAQIPQIEFHVIGSKAPRQILELAHDGVTVHGYVADIEPFMDGCRLSVAPLRYGAGVKGKVNMAMSFGLPVVATTPAVEGMHVRNGGDVLVADTPQEFAAAIVRAYNDATLWRTLSDNGLANVTRHFSFDAARAALVRILPPRQ
jgi:GT2 family glycosyltransferase/glycosyltransferase involved in cell wall biosynthesis